MTTYMVNAYYDFHNSTAFLISAQALASLMKLSNNTIPVGFDINETLFASKITLPRAGIGAKYAVTDNIMIDASYKYINAGKVSISKNHYAGDEHTAYDADTKAASNDHARHYYAF